VKNLQSYPLKTSCDPYGHRDECVPELPKPEETGFYFKSELGSCLPQFNGEVYEFYTRRSCHNGRDRLFESSGIMWNPELNQAEWTLYKGKDCQGASQGPWLFPADKCVGYFTGGQKATATKKAFN
jgi:hypothetical protein